MITANVSFVLIVVFPKTPPEKPVDQANLSILHVQCSRGHHSVGALAVSQKKKILKGFMEERNGAWVTERCVLRHRVGVTTGKVQTQQVYTGATGF